MVWEKIKSRNSENFCSSDEELDQISQALPPGIAAGNRYTDMSSVNR